MYTRAVIYSVANFLATGLLPQRSLELHEVISPIQNLFQFPPQKVQGICVISCVSISLSRTLMTIVDVQMDAEIIEFEPRKSHA